MAAVESTSKPLTILNRVQREKLPHVLAHVLEHIGTTVGRIAGLSQDTVFSETEKQQLQEMLGFSDQEIDAMVAAATEIFHDALIFGHVSTCDLINGGVQDDVIALVEKVWRKKSKQRAAAPVAPQLIDQRVPHVLQDTNWRLHLEMGHKQLSGQSNPSAIFQLSIADPQRAPSSEKLDLEFSHDALRSFLSQLNAMQTQIDDLASAAPAS